MKKQKNTVFKWIGTFYIFLLVVFFAWQIFQSVIEKQTENTSKIPSINISDLQRLQNSLKDQNIIKTTPDFSSVSFGKTEPF